MTVQRPPLPRPAGGRVRRRDAPPAGGATATVLVPQAHLRPGPWVVRSLSQAGFRVVAGSDRGVLGVRRRVGRGSVVRMPDPGEGSTAFAGALDRVVRAEGVDVVLPLAESALAALAAEAPDDLMARVAGPTREQYATLSDKARLADVARAVGVAVLPGVVAGDPGVPLPPPPVVVKPFASATRRDDASVAYVRPVLAATAEARDRAVAQIVAATGRALVQPLVEGERWHVHAWRGAAGGGGVAARVERSWPPRVGMTSASRVEAEPRAVEAALAIMAAVGYRGVTSADFMRTADGVLAVHDVNPRIPFSVGEAIAAGLDTPRIAVEIALGREPAVPEPRCGSRYHWASGEARWLARPGRVAVARQLATVPLHRDAVLEPLARGTAAAGVVGNSAGTGCGASRPAWAPCGACVSAVGPLKRWRRRPVRRERTALRGGRRGDRRLARAARPRGAPAPRGPGRRRGPGRPGPGR